MKLNGVHLKGYRISKAGKLERIPGYGKDVSAKLRERGSKRVRVVKPGTA